MTTTRADAPTAKRPVAAPAGGSKFAYVPALDGLRGVAVSAMLAYHLELSWMGDGGPISLEVFFVISGFLITSLFIRERDNTGRIDLRGFWNRRFRRLAPALIAMFVLITLWAALPERWGPSPEQRGVMRGGGLASITYVSNWYFILSGQSYFEGFGSPSPFRHTWSLSMEEQFYLVIAMGVAFGFTKWSPFRKRWLYIVGGVILASAAWMALLTRIGDLVAQGLWPFGIDPASLSPTMRTLFNFQGTGDTTRMYFGTDTRLSGVLSGALLGFILERRRGRAFSARTYATVGGVGFVALIAMIVLAPKNSIWLYFGGYLVVDLLTVSSIFVCAAPVATVWQKALSWKPLVRVGVLSYSLYVWHYPLFLILNEERLPIDGLAFDAVRLAAAGGAAWLSYHYLEQPIRKRGLGRTPRQRIVTLAMAPVIVGAFLIVMTFGATSNTSVGAPAGSDPAGIVDLPPLTGEPVVQVAGDSMAYSFGGAISKGGVDKASGVQVRLSTKLGCGIVLADFVINGKPSAQQDVCKDWRESWLTVADQAKPSVSVMMVWGWEIYDRRVPNADGDLITLEAGSDEWNALLDNAIHDGVTALTSQGGKVALTTMPCIDFNADTPKHPTNEEARDPNRVRAVNDVIRRYAAEHEAEGVVLVDVATFMCPDGEHYQSHIDGTLMSGDGIHFTPEGAEIVWNWMFPQLRAAIG